MAEQLDNLTRAATRFRQMIENSDRSRLPIEFQEFPFHWHTGPCVDAPILLAQYLIDLGYGIPTYVRGELYDPRRPLGHAWIELDGTVLDITLDGIFNDVPSVIVTRDLYWHDIFKRLDENPVAIHVFDERSVLMLRTAYHQIIGLRVH